MTLLLNKVDASDICQGSDWVVEDQDALAEHVAHRRRPVSPCGQGARRNRLRAPAER
jgi:hypothetical protein